MYLVWSGIYPEKIFDIELLDCNFQNDFVVINFEDKRLLLMNDAYKSIKYIATQNEVASTIGQARNTIDIGDSHLFKIYTNRTLEQRMKWLSTTTSLIITLIADDPRQKREKWSMEGIYKSGVLTRWYDLHGAKLSGKDDIIELYHMISRDTGVHNNDNIAHSGAATKLRRMYTSYCNCRMNHNHQV